MVLQLRVSHEIAVKSSKTRALVSSPGSAGEGLDS